MEETPQFGDTWRHPLIASPERFQRRRIFVRTTTTSAVDGYGGHAYGWQELNQTRANNGTWEVDVTGQYGLQTNFPLYMADGNPNVPIGTICEAFVYEGFYIVGWPLTYTGTATIFRTACVSGLLSELVSLDGGSSWMFAYDLGCVPCGCGSGSGSGSACCGLQSYTGSMCVTITVGGTPVDGSHTYNYNSPLVWSYSHTLGGCAAGSQLTCSNGVWTLSFTGVGPTQYYHPTTVQCSPFQLTFTGVDFTPCGGSPGATVTVVQGSCSPGSGSGSGYCYIPCSGCLLPLVIPATITGLTNGSCNNCTAVNATYSLIYTGSNACTWSATIPDAGCGTSFQISLVALSGVWSLTVGIGANSGIPATLVGSWSCNAINTFTIADGLLGGYCHGPVTIKVDTTCGGSGGSGSGSGIVCNISRTSLGTAVGDVAQTSLTSGVVSVVAGRVLYVIVGDAYGAGWSGPSFANISVNYVGSHSGTTAMTLDDYVEEGAVGIFFQGVFLFRLTIPSTETAFVTVTSDKAVYLGLAMVEVSGIAGTLDAYAEQTSISDTADTGATNTTVVVCEYAQAALISMTGTGTTNPNYLAPFVTGQRFTLPVPGFNVVVVEGDEILGQLQMVEAQASLGTANNIWSILVDTYS